MKKVLYLLFISNLGNYSIAQNKDIEIIIDPRVDALIKKQGEIIPPSTVPQITGYRIQ